MKHQVARLGTCVDNIVVAQELQCIRSLSRHCIDSPTGLISKAGGHANKIWNRCRFTTVHNVQESPLDIYLCNATVNCHFLHTPRGILRCAEKILTAPTKPARRCTRRDVDPSPPAPAIAFFLPAPSHDNPHPCVSGRHLAAAGRLIEPLAPLARL